MRDKLGLSQSQFAAFVGLSIRTIQGWEQGRNPGAYTRLILLGIQSLIDKEKGRRQ